MVDGSVQRLDGERDTCVFSVGRDGREHVNDVVVLRLAVEAVLILARRDDQRRHVVFGGSLNGLANRLDGVVGDLGVSQRVASEEASDWDAAVVVASSAVGWAGGLVVHAYTNAGTARYVCPAARSRAFPPI